MNRHGSFIMALLFFFGASHNAAADPIQVNAKIVNEDGAPIGGLQVRMVVGSEKNSRSASAGKSLTTPSNGKLSYLIDAPVKERKIKLDSAFTRHQSQLIEVGIEMDLVGRRALYWIEIDLVKAAGPSASMSALVKGAKGDFDKPLVFHKNDHSWSFPDQKNGMHLTGIGAKLLKHDMKCGTDGKWTVDLVIEKQQFTKR